MCGLVREQAKTEIECEGDNQQDNERKAAFANATIQIVPDPESGSPKLGIAEDERHAAEAMIIARYTMFNQVYFHKTRVILDIHLQNAFEAMLPGSASFDSRRRRAVRLFWNKSNKVHDKHDARHGHGGDHEHQQQLARFPHNAHFAHAPRRARALAVVSSRPVIEPHRAARLRP